MLILPLGNPNSETALPDAWVSLLLAGRTVRARVVETADGQSALRFGTARISLPEPLPAGTPVLLRLVPGSTDRIELSILPRLGDDNLSPSSTAQPAPFGSPAALVTQALSSAGLPVHESLVGQLLTLVGPLSAEQLPALIYALVHRLPLSAPILAALANALRTQANMGETLAELLALLDGPLGLPPALHATVRDALTTRLGTWERITRTRAIAEAMASAGWSYETALGRQIEAGTGFPCLPDDLKPLLLALRAYLLEQDRSPAPVERALTLTELALESIDKQRLAGHSDDGLAQRWYIQLPFLDGAIPRTIELLLQHRQNPLTPEHRESFAATVVVTLSRLGGIRAQAQLKPPDVDVTFALERSETQALLQKREADLREGLERAGFVLRGYRCQRVDAVAPVSLEEIFPELRRLPPAGIDVRV